MNSANTFAASKILLKWISSGGERAIKTWKSTVSEL